MLFYLFLKMWKEDSINCDFENKCCLHYWLRERLLEDLVIFIRSSEITNLIPFIFLLDAMVLSLILQEIYFVMIRQSTLGYLGPIQCAISTP